MQYTDIGTDGAQIENQILVNAAVQATLIALRNEIRDGADIDELAEIIEGLLYYAQGGRTQ